MAEERKSRTSGSAGKRTTAKSASAGGPAKKPATAKGKAPAKRVAASKSKGPPKKAATRAKSAPRKAAEATTAAAKAPTRPPVNLPAPAAADATSGSPAELDEGDAPTGPSLGPHTVLEKRRPAEERLAEHDQSGVDAMGKDKRRNVVGVSYGPSRARQASLYGAALAILAVIVIGGKLLADKLDEPPDQIKVEASWAQPDARQIPPKPIQ